MGISSRISFRKVFIAVYFVCFAVYLLVGLAPAEATDDYASTELSIPSIGLNTDVSTLHLGEKGLETPDTIAGRFTRNPNKTLLIGHSTTVFSNLKDIRIHDDIVYDGFRYKVQDIQTLKKSDVNMREILAEEESDTIVLMTCAGTVFDNGDATERLIVTAVR